MTTEFALWLSIGAGLLAVLYGVFSAQWIVKQPAGSERMQGIALAIQEGAAAYMNRQYTTIGAVGVVLFLVLGIALDWYSAIGFAIGAIFSGLAGYIGMFVSVRANVRTAEAAKQGRKPRVERRVSRRCDHGPAGRRARSDRRRRLLLHPDHHGQHRRRRDSRTGGSRVRRFADFDIRAPRRRHFHEGRGRRRRPGRQGRGRHTGRRSAKPGGHRGQRRR